jgi:XTP/dITP diphosphohydrolase
LSLSRLLIATTNPGKIAEIKAILDGLPVRLATPAEFPDVAAPDEKGTTFEENARQKALHYAAATGLAAVADDSGLAIDALDGAPGIHSARYNGATYEEKFRHIYSALDARPTASRTARFICAVALARGARILFEASDTVEGLVAPAPRGDGGFGYDPILYYPPLGRTLAELPPDEKRRVSHRGKAFRALRRFLVEHGVPDAAD